MPGLNLRRILGHPVSVGAVIELAVWLAVPYIVIGAVWAFIHADRVRELEVTWNKALPAGSSLVAIGQATVLWPALLLIPTSCPAAGHD